MKKIYTLLGFYFISLFALTAQCSLTSFTAEPNLELCTGEIGGVTFEFEGTDFGLNGFTVSVDGQGTSSYNIGDVYDFILLSDCEETYELTITDNDDPNCTMTTTVEPICCPCELNEFSVTDGDCNLATSSFDFTFTFDISSGSCLWYEWELTADGEPVVYNYTGNGYIYEGFNVIGNGPFVEFEICSLGNPDDCFSFTTNNPCFEVCTISDVTATLGSCEDNIFDVTIDFNYSFVGTDGFSIQGNGVDYGDFNYSDIPITLEGLAADCDMEYEFVVTDLNDNDCSDFVELGVICCPGECELSNPVFTIGECEGEDYGTFTLTIDFDYVNTGTDVFEVWANGYYGEFELEDLPITIEVANNLYDSIDVSICTETTVPTCCIYETIYNECNGYGDCTMTTLDFGGNPVCENGLIVTDWLIDGYNVSEVGYDLFINGVFSLFIPYDESDWYDFEFEAPNTEWITMEVCDNDNADCCISWEIENPCYVPCEITNLVLTPGDCEGEEEGFFTLTIAFDVVNPESDSFQVFSGGEYETFALADLPITIEVPNSFTELLDFELCLLNSDCCVYDVIENECYGLDFCQITTLDIDAICENNLVQILGSIIGDNLGELGFNLYIDDDFVLFIPYNATDFYEFEFETDNTELITIEICDSENPTCCYNFTFYNPCFVSSECMISDVSAIVNNCENGLFDVTINFEYENEGTDGFSILGNGVNYGDFNYSDLPIILEALSADCVLEYEFVITDLTENNCTDFVELGTVCCPVDCELTTFDFTDNPECFDGLLVSGDWYIDGINIGEVGFDLYIDGEYNQFIEYDTTNFYWFEFETFNYEWITMEICDYDNSNCCLSMEIENPCYEEECITNITTTVLLGDSTEFYLMLDFDYPCIPNNGFFEVTGNGVSYGYFDYDDLPIFITDLSPDCTTDYEFTITGIPNEECTGTTQVGIVCSAEDCELSEPSFTTSECEGEDQGTFNVTIDFDYINPGNDFFELWINGFHGVYELEDLPIFLVVENNISDSIDYTICINDSNCCLTGSIVNECYGYGNCLMTTIELENDPVCNNGLVSVNCLIDGYNISEQGYNVFIDGEFSFFVPIDQNNWYDVEFEVSDTEFFVLEFCDSENPDCCIGLDMINSCYVAASCAISEVIADISNCEAGLYDAVISFEYENVGNDGFTIVGNGVDYGSFSYNDLPITIEDLAADCELDYEFIVTDVNDNDCSSFVDLGLVCCIGDECELSNLEVETTICEAGIYSLTIDFEYDNPSNDNFDLWVNTEFDDFYNLNDLPLTLDMESDSAEYVLIEICINDDPDCCIAIEVENPCFEETNNFVCEITLEATTLDVEDMMVNGFIEISKDGDCSNEYDVWIDGEYNGEKQLIEGKLDLTPFVSSNEYIEFKVCNKLDSDACIIFSVLNPLLVGTNDEFESNIGIQVIPEDAIIFSKDITQKINIDIYNYHGQKITSTHLKVTEQSISIDTKKWPTGIYIAKLYNKLEYKVEKIYIQ